MNTIGSTTTFVFLTYMVCMSSRPLTPSQVQQRRIIFICHSMGGIVVKKVRNRTLRLDLLLTSLQALIIALIDSEMYNNIRTSVTAILFLGTPHRGSEETGFPLVLTNIANVALVGTSRFVGSMRSDLIKSLEKDSKILKDISTNFRNQTRDIMIASFVEQKLTPPAKTRVRTPFQQCDHQCLMLTRSKDC